MLLGLSTGTIEQRQEYIKFLWESLEMYHIKHMHGTPITCMKNDHTSIEKFDTMF